MTIAVDTNVLLRVLTDDDPKQSAAAREALANADVVVLANAALCEVVWVLARGYRLPSDRIAGAIRMLVKAHNVRFDRGAVEAGLAQLDAGGDFADGVIAHEGLRQGAATFVSFDRAAIRILSKRGRAARLLG